MNTKKFGPAFPTEEFIPDLPNGEQLVLHTGMTLRDYFAAHATESDLAAQYIVLREQSGIGILPDNYTVKARYLHADAMLAAREGGAA